MKNKIISKRSLMVFFGILLSLCVTISPSYAFKLGLILDKGGKDDKSFNNAAYDGAQKLVKEFKIELKVVEATDDNSFAPLIRAFASRKYDYIICVGFSQSDSLKKIATQFPKVHFAIVDGEVDLPNVKSLLFEEHQGSFLVGAIAALKNKTGSIGFIGGMDIPLIRRFQMGYEAGAKNINPKIKVVTNYLGFTSEAWNNPPKAKELALAQYHSGVDIIFAAAGASNQGLFDAAEENKKLAIGVDSNQNWIKPGFILTSMMKRVDVAVYESSKEALNGKFIPGVTRFGLKNSGVDYSLDKFNEKLISTEIKSKVEKLKVDIVSGKIQVPDYYEKK